MRIGLINTYMPPHPGGIEHVANNIFQGYRQSGIDVRWLTSCIPRTLPRYSDAVSRVPTFNLIEDMTGVPVPVWGLSGWKELRKFCAWADVIHIVEALYLPCAMAIAAARLSHKPIILSQNVGIIPYNSKVLQVIQKMAWATMGRSVLRAASRVVLATPTADHFVRNMRNLNIPHLSTFPVGIDTTFFRPPTYLERASAREALDLYDNRPTVLFAGRLVEKKGVPIVLDVAKRLPAITFIFAGDGPLRGLFNAPPSNVHYMGYIDSNHMRSLYHATDAVILPSKGEGLPLFIQEAMACAIPAVISNDEIYAADLLAAKLCYGAAREGSAMAQAVEVALASNKENNLRARQWAEQEWGISRMTERYLALASELLNNL